MINKEAKTGEGPDSKLGGKYFVIHLSLGMLEEVPFCGSCRLAGGHVEGTQPGPWHFGDYCHRVHEFPEYEDVV